MSSEMCCCSHNVNDIHFVRNGYTYFSGIAVAFELLAVRYVADRICGICGVRRLHLL